jgi:hypothetical protein
MNHRRPRLVLIHGGEATREGPVTRLGLRRPLAPKWVLWGGVVTKILLLVAVLAAMQALRR